MAALKQNLAMHCAIGPIGKSNSKQLAWITDHCYADNYNNNNNGDDKQTCAKLSTVIAINFDTRAIGDGCGRNKADQLAVGR